MRLGTKLVPLAGAAALIALMPAMLGAASAAAATTPSGAPQITVTTNWLTYDDTAAAPSQAEVLASAGVTATCGQPVIENLGSVNFRVTGFYPVQVTDTCDDGATAPPQTITIEVVQPVPAGTYTPLPVGDPNLTETRGIVNLAPGVTLTQIVRGTTPAKPGTFNTTLEGPFIVNVVTIDPKKAMGHLQVVRGRYLINRNTVGQLVAQANGLVGVNASFFDIKDNYGVPDALAIEDGKLVGNPDSDLRNSGFGPVIDSANNKVVLNGSYTWSGTVENPVTGQRLLLTEVDKKTVVPSACVSMTDQTQCTVSGDLVQFDPAWGAQTPTGNGVEVVLGRGGNVVAVNTTRGTALQPGQTSIQATGSDAAALLGLVTDGGHLKTTLQLFSNGQPVHLTPNLQATTASWIQVNNGVNQYPYPNGVDTPTSRNPLTAIATTRDGDIILFTVEGRSTASVGMSYPEESAALMNLGGWNALNLDGGGSTQLVADGQYVTTSSDGYVNTPSGTKSNGTERADGDAIVWVP